MQPPPTETTDATQAQAGYDAQADVVDRLGVLDMSTRLRDMLLGQDLPNALPLAYVDIRKRIVDSQDSTIEIANSLVDALEIRRRRDQERIDTLETRLQKVLTENERLRLDLNSVDKKLRDALTEGSIRTPVAPPHVQSPHTQPAGTNGDPLVTAPVPIHPQPSAATGRTIHFAPESVVHETRPTARVDESAQSYRAGPSQPPVNPPFTAPFQPPPFPFESVPPVPRTSVFCHSDAHIQKLE